MITRGRQAQADRDAIKLNRANASNGSQSVGIGDLEILPPEIRNKIYKMVLVEAESVKLQYYQPIEKLHYVINGKTTSRRAGVEVALVSHKRISTHRGQQWVGNKWIEVPSNTALLQVNKQLNAEASSILYGFNSFDFTTTKALESFLKQIGDNKQHLREIGLSYAPSGHSMSAGRRATTALLAAKSLHTLKLTNIPVENIRADSQLVTDYISDHVEMFLPLLTSLHASFQADGLDAKILDVLKLTPRRPGEKPHRSEVDCAGRNGKCWRTCVGKVCPNKPIYHLQEGDCSDRCRQRCTDYVNCYRALKTALRAEIMSQLAPSEGAALGAFFAKVEAEIYMTAQKLGRVLENLNG